MEPKLTMELTRRNRMTIPDSSSDRPFVRKFAAGNGELKSTLNNGREAGTKKEKVLRVVFFKVCEHPQSQKLCISVSGQSISRSGYL